MTEPTPEAQRLLAEAAEAHAKYKEGQEDGSSHAFSVSALIQAQRQANRQWSAPPEPPTE